MENVQLHRPPPPPPPVQSATTPLATQEVYNFASALLITQKKNVNDVRNALMQKGFDFQESSRIITELQTAVAKQGKERAKKDMMYGGGICIVGLAITLITYSIASSGGGTYFVTWGAVVFGALQFFRGLFNYMK